MAVSIEIKVADRITASSQKTIHWAKTGLIGFVAAKKSFLRPGFCGLIRLPVRIPGTRTTMTSDLLSLSERANRAVL
jgi:hypothetical protein